MTAILAYIPVLHQGYFQLFTADTSAKTLYIVPKVLAQKFTPTHKEIRALEQKNIELAIKSWKIFTEIKTASLEELEKLNAAKATVIISDELVSRGVAATYLPDCTISPSPIFLRWDAKSATARIEPEHHSKVTTDEVDQKFMELALAEGQKSSDWWRQVGAVAVKNMQLLAHVHNTHLPDEQQPYAEGDARAHFHKSEHIDLTTAIHAEAKLIAEAAATGLMLTGAELYVTDFPCPPCAKLIAHAGFKKLFYKKGYGMLDGQRVLKAAGIEIVKVE
jgi:dCMP deaminase